MNKRKRCKGLVVFMPFVAFALSLLLVSSENNYIFCVALLIASGVGCAEALLGWTSLRKGVKTSSTNEVDKSKDGKGVEKL